MDNDFKVRVKRPGSPQAKISLSEQTNSHNAAPKEVFRTPEDVAADQTLEPSEPKHTRPSSDKPEKPGKRFHWPTSRKGWVLLSAAVIVALALIGFGAYALFHDSSKKVANKQTAKTVKPAKTAPIIVSNLTGLPVDASVNARPVTGVMIENSIDARPQSGLSEAGVVFEAVAEGGITRFLALYQDNQTSNVGPIRSARPYYVSWDMGFDAAYAHVGGSPDALSDITSWGTKDMNQFYNGNSYHRVSSRAAPHNVYTGIDVLNQLETSKGFTSTYTGFPRKKATPLKTPTAGNIAMTLSSALYNTNYVYSAATNSYNRSEGGQPHIDANTSKQLSPNVVIAMVVPLSQGALDA
ncbi:MAG: DUF3048 domain-containing protein, partial [Candidatus Saccharimonadales bacterium]